MIATEKRGSYRYPRAKEAVQAWISAHPDAPPGLTADLEPLMDQSYWIRATDKITRLIEKNDFPESSCYDPPSDDVYEFWAAASYRLPPVNKKLLSAVASYRGKDYAVIIEGVKQGLTQVKIAERLGQNQCSVSNKLPTLARTAKWVYAKGKYANLAHAAIDSAYQYRGSRQDLHKMLDLYFKLGNTIMVSKELGCSQAHVSNHIRGIRKALIDSGMMTPDDAEALFPTNFTPGYANNGSAMVRGMYNGRQAEKG